MADRAVPLDRLSTNSALTPTVVVVDALHRQDDCDYSQLRDETTWR